MKVAGLYFAGNLFFNGISENVDFCILKTGSEMIRLLNHVENHSRQIQIVCKI